MGSSYEKGARAVAKDQFGTIIPRAKDIVGIEGENLITIDGERILRDLYEINKELGGGFTLVVADEFKKKSSDKQ